MGLLDDAIREHLDLKRRRGADPTEVERDERDALGPVRRVPEQHAAADYEPEPAADYEPEAGSEYEDEHEVAATGEPHVDDESWSYESSAAEPAPAEVPPPAPDFAEEDEPFSEQAPAAAEPHEPEPFDAEGAHGETPVTPAPHPADAPAPAEPEHGDQTVEYDVEAALARPERREPQPAEPGQAADEDVLEETPEFLQDTPDHDRLWFEQRPPKDFDFDG